MINISKSMRHSRIIGDSHVHSLGAAINLQKAKINSAGLKIDPVIALTAATDLYEPFYETSNGEVRIIDEKIRTRLTGILCDDDGRLLSSDGVLTLVSMGLHTNTFMESKRWKQHHYWRASKRQNCQPVTDSVFDEMTHDINRYIYGFVSELKKRGHNLKIISSPPPTRRFQALSRDWLEGDVLAVDGRFRSTVTGRFREMGIGVITPPQGVCDGGFLNNKFLNEDVRDVHHGNLSYSLLMVDELILALSN